MHWCLFLLYTKNAMQLLISYFKAAKWLSEFLLFSQNVKANLAVVQGFCDLNILPLLSFRFSSTKKKKKGLVVHCDTQWAAT